MEDVCKALDQTVLDIFQVLEELYHAKAKLELAMKDGYFQMARSRYSIGVKRVNADQILNANISCTHSVAVSENIEEIFNDFDDSDTESAEKCKVFELIGPGRVSKENVKDSGSKDTKDENNSNTELRKRGPATSETKSVDDEITAAISHFKIKDSQGASGRQESESKEKFVLTDPINLFGVLVPQTLRTSQQNFKTAVSLSIEIANLQFHLLFLQKKLASLKEKKNSLSESNPSEQSCS